MRISVAVLLGLTGVAAYIGAAVVLADQVHPYHWAIQGIYFLFAGLLWVPPVHLLMLWAARKL